MADRESAPVLDDPLGWAPMRAYRGRRTFEISDPLLEPLWSGTRALAHLAVEPEKAPPLTVALIEATGADVAPGLPLLTAALGDALMARDAIVDGVISRQVMLDGLGAAAIPEVHARATQMFARNGIDFDVKARNVTDQFDTEAERIDGFVAVDLLALDGIDLLDVPLLERKRLLESILAPGPLVRLSGHVRPPIDGWIATWKALGLRGGILKAANSRYHPNDDTIEWRIVERLGRRQ